MCQMRRALAPTADQSSDPDAERVTDATRVYLQLRSDILKGVLKPEEKLQIASVARKYQTGVNPVREALNRLSSEGVVDRWERRGFFVAPVSVEDLKVLVKTRCWLEGRALYESITNGSEEWEERIVIVFHRLMRKTHSLREITDGYVGDPDWEALHRDFHLALIAGCGSSWLIKYCTDMMDHAYRYRSISDRLDWIERDVEAEHRAIMDAAIAREADLAVSRLCDHYTLTLQIIEKTIDDPENREDSSIRAT